MVAAPCHAMPCLTLVLNLQFCIDASADVLEMCIGSECARTRVRLSLLCMHLHVPVCTNLCAQLCACTYMQVHVVQMWAYIWVCMLCV